MKTMKTAVSILLLLLGAGLQAQLGSNPLKKGNELYQEGKFDEAEVRYRKAMAEKEEENIAGRFNLGDALYRQQRYEEAAAEFGRVAELTNDPDLKGQALHNLGNSMVQQKKFEEAVNAYKEALKANPSQQDSRENLARALRQLKQQQQQQQNQKQNQDKEQQQDKQQQKNEKDQQKQKQDQQQQQQQQQDNNDQQKPDQPEEEQEQQQAQPRKDRISREDAERLLKAINADEQKVQEKVNKEKIKGRPVQTDKDW